MSERKVLRVAADDTKLEEVLALVNDLLDRYGCASRERRQIDIALEELFVNIAHYAYPNGDGWAEIEASVEDRTISVTLTDAGIPYDPLARQDPDVTLSAEERKIGGLGIFMVKKSMDSIAYRYEEGCNILTFEKTF